MEVSTAGWSFLLVISGFFPWLAIRSASKVRQTVATPTPAQHLTSVLVSQGMMLVLALLALSQERLELFPAAEPGWKEPVLALAFLVPAVGTLPLRWRWKPLRAVFRSTGWSRTNRPTSTTAAKVAEPRTRVNYSVCLRRETAAAR